MRSRSLLVAAVAAAALGGGYGAAHYLGIIPAGLDPLKSGTEASGTAAAAGGARAGRSERRGRRGRGDAVPVLTGAVAEQSVPQLLTAIGSVAAFATVAVKSRVDGQIFQAEFTEGQMVRKGDKLFQIDPRPFQVQLRQAQANLARDRAQAEKMAGDLARYGKLAGKGFASQQKYDEARAAHAAMMATLKSGAAAIEAARLQLDYSAIRSPIDGRTGSILVNPGNLVKANDTTPLVVIAQLRPIHVSFSVPERHLARLKALMAAGEAAVAVRIPGDSSAPRRGRLVFINNAVDTATGTILLKAQFENEDDALTPGQFVNVALTLRERPNALVVPSQAVQDGQNGQFVFVVSEDSTAEMRPVELDDIVGERTVIRKGLVAGERVVLDGQLQLRPGSKVVERKPGAAPPAGDRKRGNKRGGKRDGKRGGEARGEVRAETRSAARSGDE